MLHETSPQVCVWGGLGRSSGSNLLAYHAHSCSCLTLSLYASALWCTGVLLLCSPSARAHPLLCSELQRQELESAADEGVAAEKARRERIGESLVSLFLVYNCRPIIHDNVLGSHQTISVALHCMANNCTQAVLVRFGRKLTRMASPGAMLACMEVASSDRCRVHVATGWMRMCLQVLFFAPVNLLEPEESFGRFAGRLIVSPVVRVLVFSKVLPPPCGTLANLIDPLTNCWYIGSLSGRLLVSPVVRVLVFSKVPPPSAAP